MPYLINPFGALDSEMINFKSSFIKRVYIRCIESGNIRGAAAIQVASKYEKERLSGLGFPVVSEVASPGLFLDEYSPVLAGEKLEESYPQLKGKKIILFLSRVHPKKGLENLALAFKGLVQKEKDVFLVIAGTGQKSYIQKIKSLLGNLDLSNQVIFTGMLLGPKKLAAFYGSDIFVLPSYGENFGIAVLEAMACSLPVIITDKVGLGADVEDYKAGIVLNNDPRKIEEALYKLITLKDSRKVMGEGGRRLAREKFRLSKVTDDLISIYKGVIKK